MLSAPVSVRSDREKELFSSWERILPDYLTILRWLSEARIVGEEMSVRIKLPTTPGDTAVCREHDGLGV